MPKGHTNNPNGRPKGTPNKATAAIKEKLTAFLSKEINNLPKLAKDLTPSERVYLLSKLIGYVLPKQQEIDIKTEIDALFANINTLDDTGLNRLREIVLTCLPKGFEPDAQDIKKLTEW